MTDPETAKIRDDFTNFLDAVFAYRESVTELLGTLVGESQPDLTPDALVALVGVMVKDMDVTKAAKVIAGNNNDYWKQG